MLFFLEVKPEFISDIGDTEKLAWQHSLARSTLGFSKKRKPSKKTFLQLVLAPGMSLGSTAHAWMQA